MKKSAALELWRNAVIEAKNSQLLNAEWIEVAVLPNARMKNIWARAVRSLNWSTYILQLNQSAPDKGPSVQMLADHEVCHCVLFKLADQCDCKLDDLEAKHPEFGRFIESLCDHIAAVCRNMRERP
ncbi:MAG: hypothetical protein WC683_06075 [bacterium]